MLEVKDLRVRVEDKEILRGISLNVGKGEEQAIMGHNSCGKATLAGARAGRAGYETTGGSVPINGQELLDKGVILEDGPKGTRWKRK